MKSIKERRQEIERKNSKLLKFTSVCLMAGIAFIGIKHLSSPAEPERVYEPWQKADAACLNYVHQQLGGSVFKVSTGSNKDVGNNTFKVRVNVSEDNKVISVDCFATGNGKVKEVGAFKIRAN